MERIETDDAGAPIIRSASAAIKTLERRRDYLERRLNNRDSNSGAAQFDREECSALTKAIAALRYHRAEVDGEDTARLALDAIVSALNSGNEEEVRSAKVRAETLLRDL